MRSIRFGLFRPFFLIKNSKISLVSCGGATGGAHVYITAEVSGCFQPAKSINTPPFLQQKPSTLTRFLGLIETQANGKFRRLFTSSLSNITQTRIKIKVLKRSSHRLIMHMKFYLMKRREKIMICMGMRGAVLDLMLAILGTTGDILTSQVVDQVDGNIWVDREIPSHSHFPLGTVVPFWWFQWFIQNSSGSGNYPKSIQDINSQVFKKEIADQGITWLLLSYSPTLSGIQYYESIIEEVATSLQGALKAGSIYCENEPTFCKELGIYPRKAPRVFVYSYKAIESGSLVEYKGDWATKNLKGFCQEHLPRFSKRVDLDTFDFSSGTVERLPRVMLLSTKKDTPVIWRALSGLYRKRFIFYDVEVHDASDKVVKKLGVDALPAIVGWMSNGEKHVLRTGISVKDLNSAIQELSTLLNGFEKKNKKATSSQTKKPETESVDKQIHLLTASNLDAICGETIPVCLIGVFRSSKAREKVESILSVVSQKSLSRRQNPYSGSKDSISYTLLDATKQPAFLTAFDNSGFKSFDKLLIAYKSRKGKFAAYTSEITVEEVERFISSVLNGDIQFTKIKQKPKLR
ncbi:unnamed protein product, partial [Vitis vinifera]